MIVDWVKIGSIAGVVGAVAAVLTFAFPRDSSGGGAQPPTSTSQLTSTQSSAPAGGDCIDGQGQPAGCMDSDAGLVVAASPCDVDVALRTMGVDTGLRQVDVRAEVVGERCVLKPGALAAPAGASAQDIRRLGTAESVPALSLCYATQGGPEVPCSAPHTIEYVRPWQTNDDGQATQVCDAAARRYTNRTFDSPTEELKVGALKASGQFRCAVAAPEPLTASVWQIGGAAIR